MALDMATSYRLRRPSPVMPAAPDDKARIDPPEKPGPTIRPIKGAGAFNFLLDDDRCTMVIVFPRVKAAGGAMDPGALVEDPARKARQIFFCVDNPASDMILKEFEDSFDTESMLMYDYQVLTRNMLKKILAESGIEATSSPSIDEDEDFVKLYIDPNGYVIRQMAAKIRYEMPLKASVYEKVKPRGPYQGETPMVLSSSTGFARQRKNNEKRMHNDQNWSTASGYRKRKEDDNGVYTDAVFAYDTYSIEEADQFQPFKLIDACRILEFWLDQWVSLDEMKRQGIIIKYFPCPKVETVEELYERIVAGARGRWFLPSHEFDDMLREYFGEQITFFFRFLAYLTRSMALLAAVGLVYYILHKIFYRDVLPGDRDGTARSAFGVYVSLWAAFLFQVFNIRSARTKISWGVEHFDAYEQVRPEWDYTKGQGYMSLFVNACAIAYAGVYILVIFAILHWQKSLNEDAEARDTIWASIAGYALTAAIKGGSFLWGKLVPALVGLENHRSQATYDNKICQLLASVKVFVALWPFITQCFFARRLDAKCGDSFEAAAGLVWHGAYNASKIDTESVELLKSMYSYTTSAGEVCILGCFPSLGKIHPWSTTNCETLLKMNLRTFFAIQVATEIGFVVFAICLTRFELWQEQRKIDQQRASKDEYAGADHPISFLGFTAKLHEYELESWGGSIIDDFLEIAVSYAIVVSFGLITPLMAVFALAGLSLSYHIRMYRMLFVTQRPLPRRSAGLGVWESVFEMINTCAVVINTALVALFFYPGSSMPLSSQFAIFIILEHAILLLRSVIGFLVPDEPPDVIECGHYNAYVKITGLDSHSMTPTWPGTSLNHLNLDPNPDGLQSDESESEDALIGSSSGFSSGTYRATRHAYSHLGEPTNTVGIRSPRVMPVATSY